jgi:hypothetical protein
MTSAGCPTGALAGVDSGCECPAAKPLSLARLMSDAICMHGHRQQRRPMQNHRTFITPHIASDTRPSSKHFNTFSVLKTESRESHQVLVAVLSVITWRPALLAAKQAAAKLDAALPGCRSYLAATPLMTAAAWLPLAVHDWPSIAIPVSMQHYCGFTFQLEAVIPFWYSLPPDDVSGRLFEKAPKHAMHAPLG